MIRFTHAEFVTARDEFDAAVSRTPDVSRFCSGSAWGLAADQQLESAEHRSGESLFVREGEHWLAFVSRTGQVFEPLENAWMFGSPVIGPDPEKGVDLFFRAARELIGGRRRYLISGVRPQSGWHRAYRQLGGRIAGYREFEGTSSMTIDLEKGAEAWRKRRSRSFRKSLRAAERKSEAAGVTIEAPAEETAEDLFDRMLEIQKKTRKWRLGTDIFQFDDCARFYRQLLADLKTKGRLRLQFARHDGRDIAHIFGGEFGGEYRGLQMSYLEDYAFMGIGNVLQFDNLQRRSQEGSDIYDLGMPSDYKNRWADREEASVICVLEL